MRPPSGGSGATGCTAYDRGINYFDCAPSYFDGEAEIKLGEALRPYRSKVFLAEKTTRRDAKGAREELERTLQRFHTDHVDLYQFHAVSSMEDVDQILAPGGAAETFLAAKKEGKVRHLGFSAHNAPAALRLMDALELDSVLFPVNVNAWENGGFGPQILAKAKSKGMARMALKALAFGQWPADLEERSQVSEVLVSADRRSRDGPPGVAVYLEQEITAAVPPGDERIFDLALELASAPLPQLSSAELAATEDKDFCFGAGVSGVTLEPGARSYSESEGSEFLDTLFNVPVSGSTRLKSNAVHEAESNHDSPPHARRSYGCRTRNPLYSPLGMKPLRPPIPSPA